MFGLIMGVVWSLIILGGLFITYHVGYNEGYLEALEHFEEGMKNEHKITKSNS